MLSREPAPSLPARRAGDSATRLLSPDGLAGLPSAVALEEPVDPVPVGQVAVGAERQVPEVVEQVRVGPSESLPKISLSWPYVPPVRYSATVFPGRGRRVWCCQSVAENSSGPLFRWAYATLACWLGGAWSRIGVSPTRVMVSSPPRQAW